LIRKQADVLYQAMPDKTVRIRLPKQVDPAFSNQPLTVILVRHGQQLIDVADPERDPPLSDLGWKQAERVARRLASLRLDHIYTSDLQRANDTTRAIGRMHPDTPLTVTADVREVLNYHFVDDPPPDHLDIQRILSTERAAIDRFIAHLRRNHEPGQRVLVVCHGNIIRTLMPLLGGRNPKESVLMDINHAAVSIMEVWASGNAILRLANCVKHLDDEMVT